MNGDLLPFLRMTAQFHWREKTLNRLAAFIESISSNQVRNYAEQIKIFNAKEKEDIYSPEFHTRGGENRLCRVSPRRSLKKPDKQTFWSNYSIPI